MNGLPEKDYTDFLAGGEVLPPHPISARIHAMVAKDLNPSPWAVFAKLAGIVFVVGLATLKVCPEFGDGVPHKFNPMRHLMKFGMPVCQMACGALFMGGAFFIATLAFRPEELRVLRRTRFLQVSTLSGISLAGFVCAGSSVLTMLMTFWLLGAILGGALCLEVGYVIRRRRIVGVSAS